MSRLANLVSDALKSPRGTATAGSNSAWFAKVVKYPDGTATVRVRHYSTTMLVADLEPDSTASYVFGRGALGINTGHGSVSDQNGINQILRDIGLMGMLNYRRDYRGGGPRIDSRYGEGLLGSVALGSLERYWTAAELDAANAQSIGITRTNADPLFIVADPDDPINGEWDRQLVGKGFGQ